MPSVLDRLFTLLIGSFLHRMERLTKKEKKALEAYMRDLRCPPRKTEQPLVVCMVGLVGSGKTLVAKALASRLGATVVNGDQIRMCLRAEGLKFERARLLGEIAMHTALEQGSNVVLDSDHIDPAKRASVQARAEKMGVRLVFIRVVCDPDVTIGNIMKGDYNSGDGPFFRDAPSTWSDPSNRGAVVKMREMVRRIPHHYSWTGSGGGTLALREVPFTLFATIDSNDPHRDEHIREIAQRLCD